MGKLGELVELIDMVNDFDNVMTIITLISVIIRSLVDVIALMAVIVAIMVIYLNPNQAGVSESLKRGGAKWPTGENRLYWPYFCILNIKNHIKGL